MTGRRAFIAGVAAGVAGLPRGVFAQRDKTVRIGFFYFGSRQSSVDTGRFDAFLLGMREQGYVEGTNLVIEARFGDGRIDRLPALAAELVGLRVDAIVATGSPVYSALRYANTTVPVVITVTADPVIEGIAASVARPGGNFTGLTDTAADLGPKQLELLTAVRPQLSRIGFLMNPGNLSHPSQLKRVMVAAQKTGVHAVLADAEVATDIEPAFTLLAKERADAVILFGDTFFVQQLQQIAQSAIRHRMPSMYLIREYAAAGGLMSYGANIVENFRRAASYVDRILKGAKAGSLPFEQPSRYSLAINLRTAKALGLTVPQSLLLRADEVIQ